MDTPNVTPLQLPPQQQAAQLNVGHLKNVLLLARNGIAAIGSKLPAHEGKAANERPEEVEKFVFDFERLQNPQMQQPGMPQAPRPQSAIPDDIQVTTVKIGD